ncbi:hypothetical protein IMZ48_31995 [Candidatus Bathyarchaeota archaeon]|nr:hypothetical protein [Candidatus Bathyarchaeota archaeon]
MTPGHAIASFIADPDPSTADMSTLCFQDKVSPILCLRRKRDSPTLSGPREWWHRRRYMCSSIPVFTWLLMHLFLSNALGTLAYSYFRFGLHALTPGSFAHSPKNGLMRSMDVTDGAFLLALLMGSKSQVLLAACFYFYNGLTTRFMVDSEWNAYNLAYRPLRVTLLEGSQTSTYHLQLPYKLGLPLAIVAALLHWKLSNTYYLGVPEGVQFPTPPCQPRPLIRSTLYFGSDHQGLLSVQDDLGLDPNTIIALSYSVKALLVLSIAAALLVSIPVLVAQTKLSGDILIAGANSRVISAA